MAGVNEKLVEALYSMVWSWPISLLFSTNIRSTGGVKSFYALYDMKSDMKVKRMNIALEVKTVILKLLGEEDY